MLATLLNKRLWHRCFAVNFAKFLRTRLFLQSTSGGCFSLKNVTWYEKLPFSWFFGNIIFNQGFQDFDRVKRVKSQKEQIKKSKVLLICGQISVKYLSVFSANTRKYGSKNSEYGHFYSVKVTALISIDYLIQNICKLNI